VVIVLRQQLSLSAACLDGKWGEIKTRSYMVARIAYLHREARGGFDAVARST
jgi:hypothetical protein